MAINREKHRRWRCLEVGCNPKLRAHNAQAHAEATGHRVAKWPVRGGQKARRRPNDYPDDPTPFGSEEEVQG